MFRSMPSGRNPGAFAYIGIVPDERHRAARNVPGRGGSEPFGTICTPLKWRHAVQRLYWLVRMCLFERRSLRSRLRQCGDRRFLRRGLEVTLADISSIVSAVAVPAAVIAVRCRRGRRTLSA
jgi:hypothetical protein